MKGKTKSKILSILVVVSMLIGMFSGLEVFADETTGRVEVTFREATEEKLKGCMWADVRFYNASCNVLGTKFTYDPDKLDFINKSSGATLTAKAIKTALDVKDVFYEDEDTGEITGLWQIQTSTLDKATKVATVELNKSTSEEISLNTTDESASINENGFIDANDKGYLAYSICMKLKGENATISDLNGDVIKFYQAQYDTRNLGAKAQKGQEGQQLTSATICYPKTVKFLDAKDSTNAALATKQASVDVTNTYAEGTGTTQATSYNALAKSELPTNPTSDTKTFAGWYYEYTEGDAVKEAEFVADDGTNTASATKVENNMTVYAKWAIAGDLTGDEKVDALDLAKALLNYNGDADDINKVLNNYGN